MNSQGSAPDMGHNYKLSLRDNHNMKTSIKTVLWILFGLYFIYCGLHGIVKASWPKIMPVNIDVFFIPFTHLDNNNGFYWGGSIYIFVALFCWFEAYRAHKNSDPMTHDPK